MPRVKRKICRVIYRLWHEHSEHGLIGYIGKDKHYPERLNLKQRAKQKGCTNLYSALNKYPLDIWHKEILESGFETDESLAEAEIKWIASFDSKNKGYNLTDGGDGCKGYCSWTDERKKRASERETWNPEDIKEAIKLYEMEKWSSVRLGHKYNISPNVVIRFLARNGVRIRSRYETQIGIPRDGNGGRVTLARGHGIFSPTFDRKTMRRATREQLSLAGLKSSRSPKNIGRKIPSSYDTRCSGGRSSTHLIWHVRRNLVNESCSLCIKGLEVKE